MVRLRFSLLVILLASTTSATSTTSAFADTGVSDERVVLPDGPGSIGGVGENVEVDPNMGAMRYSVPLKLLSGFAAATPKLALNYSSSAGSSLLGIGWSLQTPCIERATFRGLPTYDQDDLFAANGSDELVRVADGATPTYRARFEKAFTRYRWHDAGDGAGGYWTAEFRDGRVGYYGADADGNVVESARVTGPDGQVFRYHVVDEVDPHGHRVHYEYTKSGGSAVVSRIGYAFEGSRPRFSVRLAYEDREDILSDAKPGFIVELDKRLREVEVLSRSEVVRRYALSYEDYDDAGGFSRLAGVTEYGRGDSRHPLRFRFGYSRSLGGACENDCEKPFVVRMGKLAEGVDLRTGRATLIDINGDSLPDILNTSESGQHTFHISELSPEGRPGFGGSVVESAMTPSSSSFVLSAPGVQVLDVDGDGFTDIISSFAGEVFCNTGAGDWSGTGCMDNATLPTLSEDPQSAGDANPLGVRFFDYDNDKRIDMLRTAPGDTSVHVNTGERFDQVSIEEIGVLFDQSTLQLSDVNGDGLQDPVEIQNDGTMRYRINLGLGRWGEWVIVDLGGFGEVALLQATLEDLNGDGLADVVVVAGDELKYALNRNGDHFDAVVTVRSDQVEGDLPERTATTTVLFADMNGNGTRDPVWLSSDGDAQFLELFPVKPNLLSRIENGIGHVQTIEYGTSVAELARDARDGRPWAYKLNHAMNVVKRKDTWVTLTGGEDGEGLHEVEAFDYHDGFYDGQEKQFRGYASVERRLLADMDRDSQEPARVELDFDVGATDAYFNGLMVAQKTFGGADLATPISEEHVAHDDCDVSGIDRDRDDLTRDVRFICEVARTTVMQEGASAAAWATTLREMAYDGYGNVTEERSHGVIHMGPPDDTSACDACTGSGFGMPCDAECLGDERFVQRSYVKPGADTDGLWYLGLVAREVTFGEMGGLQKETLTYYDGDHFRGLPAGEARRGLATRVMQRVSEDDDDFIAAQRYAYDEHGNVVASLDPLGDPDDRGGHRRHYRYGDNGLSLTRAEILLSDDDGDYQLRRDVAYEDAFNQPSEATAWMLVRGGELQSARNSVRYRYDDHGRITKRIDPGDSDAAPTEEYLYELSDPASRIRILKRSRVGGDPDLEEVRCLDGRGREYQRRNLIESDAYLVSGFKEFNRRGTPVRVYQPYTSDGGACDAEPDSGVLFTATRYDALGREVRVTLPDEALYEGASTTRKVYEPLGVVSYDQLDNDAESPQEDTPTRVRRDGLGRTVGVQRFLKASGAGIEVEIEYDSLGRIAAFTDPEGHRRGRAHDLLDRVVSVDNPDGGRESFTYDAAGNQRLHENAEGDGKHSEYDGANRLLRSWSDKDRDASLIEFVYDAPGACDDCSNVAGRLVETRYPLRSESMASEGFDRSGYDARGQLIHVERELEGYTFAVETEYDNARRVARRQYPDGQVQEWRYDGASRVIGIPGTVASLTYDERGLLQQLDYANGIEAGWEFDALLRVSHLHTARGDELLQARDYTRDRVGNITRVEDGSSERDGAIDLTARYAYDAWYRLVEARYADTGADDDSDGEGEGGETVTFDFDDLDNIASITSSRGEGSRAHLGELAYDADHPGAVTGAGGVERSYDAAGRMRARGAVEYGWDYRDRMVSAKRDGETLAEFVYGPDHMRIMKLEDGGAVYYVGLGFEVRDGIGVLYPQVGSKRVARHQSDRLQTRLLSDLDDDDMISAADAWLAHAGAEGLSGVDKDASASPPRRLLRASARRMLHEAGPKSVFLHHDHLGSATLATDDEGHVVGERDYYPTGTPRAEHGHVDLYGFTGQELDESTGLIHFAHRYLDPVTARWVSPDPAYRMPDAKQLASKRESGSRYAYVENNFVNAVDPTGLRKVLKKTWYMGKNNKISAYKLAKSDRTSATLTYKSRNPQGDQPNAPQELWRANQRKKQEHEIGKLQHRTEAFNSAKRVAGYATTAVSLVGVALKLAATVLNEKGKNASAVRALNLTGFALSTANSLYGAYYKTIGETLNTRRANKIQSHKDELKKLE